MEIMKELRDPWMFPIVGRRAVVTGGTKGIGRSIVEELCKKGARVLTCSRHKEDLQNKMCLWTQEDYDVEGLVADLSTSSGRYAFADAIRIWLDGDPLDVLVNNVGHQPTSGHLNEKEKDDIWASNFHSMFMLTSICHEHLKRSPGARSTSSVVNIASVVGFADMTTNAPYPAAKAAVIKATGDLACEWGKDGIRVNCVCPWLIRPDASDASVPAPLQPEHQPTTQVPGTPLGRMGEATEVAGLVTFLSLPIAGFITGQVICVDGGYSRSEYYDQVSAQEMRNAQGITVQKESMPHLAMPRLEEICLGEDEKAFDVKYFESNKPMFGRKKKDSKIDSFDTSEPRVKVYESPSYKSACLKSTSEDSREKGDLKTDDSETHHSVGENTNGDRTMEDLRETTALLGEFKKKKKSTPKSEILVETVVSDDRSIDSVSSSPFDTKREMRWNLFRSKKVAAAKEVAAKMDIESNDPWKEGSPRIEGNDPINYESPFDASREIRWKEFRSKKAAQETEVSVEVVVATAKSNDLDSEGSPRVEGDDRHNKRSPRATNRKTGLPPLSPVKDSHRETNRKAGLPPLSPAKEPPRETNRKPPLAPAKDTSSTQPKKVRFGFKSAPLPPLTVIDEVVEADFDRSEPIDLDRVRSFRDRLKKIQEKKFLRRSKSKSLLERSKSLGCVFPSPSPSPSIEDGSGEDDSGEDDSSGSYESGSGSYTTSSESGESRESRDSLQECLAQAGSREI